MLDTRTKLLTRKQVAELLNVTVKTVRRWEGTEKGRPAPYGVVLVPIWLGPRSPRYDLAQIERMLAERQRVRERIRRGAGHGRKQKRNVG